ncbi:MAG TPA: sodium:proton antiporter NhaD [Rhabdochlamydiaceae bacterium]|jgi:NhaD family Na+/H+ antiporter
MFGDWFLLIAVFCIGYIAIIFEHYIKINKSAVALFIGVACWTVYIYSSTAPVSQDVAALGHHVGEISQIIFFLMGAMTLVELIDAHQGFKIITDRIKPTSEKKMLWLISALTFFLSAVLDNLTTTILMASLLRKLVPQRHERFLLCCMVVIAANAGGAWTPIGDVTTTMLWINHRLSTLSVMEALFIPSLVSVMVPLLWYSFRAKGRFTSHSHDLKKVPHEPGAQAVFFLGIGGLICVPIFKSLTGLPPFMGVILALGVLWLFTDIIHYKYEERVHLRIPHILTRVDTSGILFFLGILLCVNSLQTAGILQVIADWLTTTVSNHAMIATLFGFFSAVIDNVPLVAAVIGMYSLEAYPMDAPFWHMIAYAAGTGGSMLIIGSAAGVALMGIEKIDFIAYLRRITVPAAVGFLAGMGAYLLLRSLLF